MDPLEVVAENHQLQLVGAALDKLVDATPDERERPVHQQRPHLGLHRDASHQHDLEVPPSPPSGANHLMAPVVRKHARNRLPEILASLRQ